MRFSEFIREDKILGTLTIFDVDECLFKTTANVHVIKNGERVKSLSNHEFNTHKLEPEHEFDFSEFTDAEKFYKESKPINRMISKAKIILKNTVINPLNRVIIITARQDFDDKGKFLAKFIQHGLDMSKIYVERSGNLKLMGAPAMKKVVIIKRYLDTKKYTKVRFFDDSITNLKAFLNLQQSYPSIKFEAYLADSEGRIKTIK